jgi:hypothetical protein
VTAGTRRWWLRGALRRGPIVRTVDRIEAYAVVACIVLLAFAVHPAVDVAQSVYTTSSAAFAKETATRHLVEAVALEAGRPTAQGPGAAYSAHVQWFSRNETHDKLIRMDHAVKSGDHVRIWVTDEGKATSPPRNDSDARADSVGAGAVVWLAALAAGLCALAVLRRGLDRLRYRAWDRDLRTLVDNDGGWATRNT